MHNNHMLIRYVLSTLTNTKLIQVGRYYGTTIGGDFNEDLTNVTLESTDTYLRTIKKKNLG